MASTSGGGAITGLTLNEVGGACGGHQMETAAGVAALISSSLAERLSSVAAAAAGGTGTVVHPYLATAIASQASSFWQWQQLQHCEAAATLRGIHGLW